MTTPRRVAGVDRKLMRGWSKRKTSPTDHCPSSGTHPFVVVAGLIAFIASVGLLYLFQTLPDGIGGAALLVICVTTGAIFLVDIMLVRAHAPVDGTGLLS